MNIVRIALASLFAAISCGCSTVHTGADDAAIIGFWIGSEPTKHKLVVDVLRDHGIEASADGTGVRVADEQSSRAYDALLVDERIRGSGLMLSAFVVAGTGRPTANGYEAVLFKIPDEPPTAPSTAPAGQ